MLALKSKESIEADPPLMDDGMSQPDSFFLAKQIASVAVDVLLEGETGSGKDTLAEEIHRKSGRPGRFVAINCAALPENIAESELFGYEPGAFTGASSRAKEGKFELADKGTLYLDEIDSMPLALQAKLLRALQVRGAERLGGTRLYRSDFRVIASTKIPLATLVERGQFRSDLYYRLNVVKLRLPALRHAQERIIPLFESFLAEACVRYGRAVPAVTERVQRLLKGYDWPGNIRELKNAAERFALCLPPVGDEYYGASPVENEDESAVVEQEEQYDDSEALSLRERLKCFERQVIVDSLKRHGGSVTKASKELQLPANTLYYRIKTLGIRVNLRTV